MSSGHLAFSFENPYLPSSSRPISVGPSSFFRSDCNLVDQQTSHCQEDEAECYFHSHSGVLCKWRPWGKRIDNNQNPRPMSTLCFLSPHCKTRPVDQRFPCRADLFARQMTWSKLMSIPCVHQKNGSRFATVILHNPLQGFWVPPRKDFLGDYKKEFNTVLCCKPSRVCNIIIISFPSWWLSCNCLSQTLMVLSLTDYLEPMVWQPMIGVLMRACQPCMMSHPWMNWHGWKIQRTTHSLKFSNLPLFWKTSTIDYLTNFSGFDQVTRIKMSKKQNLGTPFRDSPNDRTHRPCWTSSLSILVPLHARACWDPSLRNHVLWCCRCQYCQFRHGRLGHLDPRQQNLQRQRRNLESIGWEKGRILFVCFLGNWSNLNNLKKTVGQFLHLAHSFKFV